MAAEANQENVARQHAGSRGLYEYARVEIERHLEDSEVSKLGHWYAAAVLHGRHRNFIAIPAIVLAAMLTWLLQNSLDELLSPPTARFLSTVVPRFLALIVTLLTALDLLLSLKSLEAAHRNAALSYHEIWRHCKNWHTDFPDETYAERAAQAAREYRDRMNSINRNSPQLPNWAWKSVSAQRAAGSVNYSVETAEALSSREYPPSRILA